MYLKLQLNLVYNLILVDDTDGTNDYHHCCFMCVRCVIIPFGIEQCQHPITNGLLKFFKYTKDANNPISVDRTMIKLELFNIKLQYSYARRRTEQIINVVRNNRKT